MKHLWWIGALCCSVLIFIIRFTDWRFIPCDSNMEDKYNYTLETLSFSYLAGAIFYFLNDYLPQIRRQKEYANYITRQIKFIKENIRLIVESIEPFKMDKKYNKNHFCSVFKGTDLSSSFMGGPTTKEEYINKKKKSIEATCEQLLGNYGNYLNDRDLKFVNSIENSYFIQNKLNSIDFNIPKELLSSYPNNQEEFGDSIFEIFEWSKQHKDS